MYIISLEPYNPESQVLWEQRLALLAGKRI